MDREDPTGTALTVSTHPFPSHEDHLALRQIICEGGGYASLSELQRWRWHSYDYAWRWVLFGDRHSPADNSDPPRWRNDAFIAQAAEFWRLKLNKPLSAGRSEQAYSEAEIARKLSAAKAAIKRLSSHFIGSRQRQATERETMRRGQEIAFALAEPHDPRVAEIMQEMGG